MGLVHWPPPAIDLDDLKFGNIENEFQFINWAILYAVFNCTKNENQTPQRLQFMQYSRICPDKCMQLFDYMQNLKKRIFVILILGAKCAMHNKKEFKRNTFGPMIATE